LNQSGARSVSIQRIVGVAAAAAVALSLCGCSDFTAVTMNSDRTQEQTAAVLGVQPEDVKIFNLQEDMSHVYYEAQTRNGRKYTCTAHLMGTPSCKQEKW
jgi:hypothetical protein